MATWYVGPGGNDASAGTSWGARWLTITKALTTGNGIASGDTVWVGPGTYREVFAATLAPAGAVNYRADVSGTNTDGIGGAVRMTGFTTDDKSASSASTTLDLNGKNFYNFFDFDFDGGTGLAINFGSGHDNSFTRCLAVSQVASATQGTTTVDVAYNLTIDSCIFISHAANHGMNLTLVRPSAADLNNNIAVKNSILLSYGGGRGMIVNASGANTFNGGGIGISGSIAWGGANKGIQTATAAQLSTTFPLTIYGSIIVSGNDNALAAATAGQIIEDYNQLYAGTPRTNVTAGTHSVGNRAGEFLGIDYGNSWIHSLSPRPMFSPIPGSQLLFANAQASMPSTDMLGRPRSPDALQAIGAFEQYSPAVQDTGGDVGDCIAITGPGAQDFYLAVDGSATTITVKAKTTGYTGTNYPVFEIYDDGGALISSTSFTVSSSGAWESKTSASFTPPDLPAGTDGRQYVLRLRSRDGAITGVTRFDTVSVT